MTPHDGSVRILDDLAPGSEPRPFLPAAARDWLLPLYDPLTRLAGVRRRHDRVVDLAAISAGQSVLDVGCGTGNLALAVLRAVPGAQITGLDPDPKALRTAARKLTRARASATLVRGYADHLPAPDRSLDHVVSALALHHIDDRESFAAEAFRVLAPGGRVTILDFAGDPGDDADHRHGGSHDGHRHHHGLGRRGIQQRSHANAGGALATLLSAAGFADAREVAHEDSWFGSLTYVQASRP